MKAIKTIILGSSLILFASCLSEGNSRKTTTAATVSTTDYDKCVASVVTAIQSTAKSNSSYTLPNGSDAIQEDVDAYIVSKNQDADETARTTYCKKSIGTIKNAVLATYKNSGANDDDATGEALSCMDSVITQLAASTNCTANGVTEEAISISVNSYILALRGPTIEGRTSPEGYCISQTADVIISALKSKICLPTGTFKAVCSSGGYETAYCTRPSYGNLSTQATCDSNGNLVCPTVGNVTGMAYCSSVTLAGSDYIKPFKCTNGNAYCGSNNLYYNTDYMIKCTYYSTIGNEDTTPMCKVSNGDDASSIGCKSSGGIVYCGKSNSFPYCKSTASN